MLKTLILKNTPIPVPIAVFTLSEAVRWIEEDLLLKDTVLVSLVLDGKEFINELYRRSVKELILRETSQLQILVENPRNIQSQSLEVTCDLAYGISSRIRKVDFQIWGDFSLPLRSELEEIVADLQLLLEILQHLVDLSEENLEFSGIDRLKKEIRLDYENFQCVFQDEDKDALSRVLKEDIYRNLRRVISEGEALQVKFLTSC